MRLPRPTLSLLIAAFAGLLLAAPTAGATSPPMQPEKPSDWAGELTVRPGTEAGTVLLGYAVGQRCNQAMGQDDILPPCRYQITVQAVEPDKPCSRNRENGAWYVDPAATWGSTPKVERGARPAGWAQRTTPLRVCLTVFEGDYIRAGYNGATIVDLLVAPGETVTATKTTPWAPVLWHPRPIPLVKVPPAASPVAPAPPVVEQPEQPGASVEPPAAVSAPQKLKLRTARGAARQLLARRFGRRRWKLACRRSGAFTARCTATRRAQKRVVLVAAEPGGVKARLLARRR